MKCVGIIPARFASTRFPGKPLVKIGDKYMVQLVYEKALLADLDEVIIATDDVRIFDAAKSFGANVVMTANTHISGTDRICEVAENIEADIIVNIQGDEPFIDPQQINAVINVLKEKKELKIATLCKQITDYEQLINPNIVKVVKTSYYHALYFSRNPIPYVRGENIENWLSVSVYYKHIGLYAFRKKALKRLINLEPSVLELSENLEQLRWLENGFHIGIAVTDIETIGIDTPEDLVKVLKIN